MIRPRRVAATDPISVVALHKGHLSQEVHDALLADVDARLLQLESHWALAAERESGKGGCPSGWPAPSAPVYDSASVCRMLDLVLLLLGGVLLYFGAEWLVSGASSLALALRIPKL
ncbi:MAG: hypothetical protein E6Q99_02165, partial [Elusimicrobia bacterium]